MWRGGPVSVLLLAAFTARAEEQERIAVRLVTYHDLSEPSEPQLLELSGEKYLTVKEDGKVKLKVRLLQLPDCRAAVQIESGEVIGTEPKVWPASLDAGADFVIKLNYPRHILEVRGSVVGLGLCERAAPNRTMEPTR